jgi:peptide/nickel transport system substrate-binding protein
LIYNSLLRADERMRLQPELAERWTAPDDRTYLFDLRRDAKFHDGKPLTAEDVRYTYESILDPKSRSPKRGMLKPLDGIDLIGPHRVRFRLSAPHAPFLEQFTIGIVPVGSPGAEINALPPPGSGPFMLESVDSGEKVTLKVNPIYWEGKPSLAGLVFKVVPDALVRVLEFRHPSVQQNDISPMRPANEKASVAAHHDNLSIHRHQSTHPIPSAVRGIALAIDRDRDSPC